MSAYVPPHSRNKGRGDIASKVEERKISKLIRTEANFPTLPSGYAKPPSVWGGPKSFAVLASEWKEKSDEKKQSEEYRRIDQPSTAPILPTPLFYHMQPIEYEEDDVSDKAENGQNSEEEWTLISKKVRLAKDINHEQLEKEYAENERGEEESSMWNDHPREHETYWDERRA